MERCFLVDERKLQGSERPECAVGHTKDATPRLAYSAAMEQGSAETALKEPE
jgi:hypothetical protein